jgi:predicted ribosomally synthesized peptide with nif11-like leader
MSIAEVNRLFGDAQESPNLKKEMNKAPDLEGFVKMAQEMGYDFTIEEWLETTGFQVEEYECELSEIPGI